MKINFICLVFMVASNVFCKNFSAALSSSDYLHLRTITNLDKAEIEKILKIFDEKETFFEKGAAAEYWFFLPELINKLNLKKGCEVGTLYGGHADSILRLTNVEKLYCVDAYKAEHLWMDQRAADVLYFLTQRRLAQWGNRLVFMRSLSSDASASFKKHELDFVFIDADHSYEGVKLDLELWFDKVKPGGIFAGDDYTAMFPGVIRAVNEFLKAKGLEVNTAGTNNRVWWAQKN